MGYVEASSYINEDVILVYHFPYLGFLLNKLIQKQRNYWSLSGLLELFLPEVLFLHDEQFLGIDRRLCKKEFGSNRACI